MAESVPATSFEKLLSAWLLSSLSVTLMIILLLTGLSFIVETISATLSEYSDWTSP